MEDQDFFRFFGIFRSVKLKAKPCVHVEDIFIRPILWNSNIQGNLEVNAKLSMVYAKDIRVTAVLRDKGKICWSQDMKMQYSDKGTSNILQVTGALKDTLPISITPWDPIDFFKAKSEKCGIPYQTLINLYLSDCKEQNRELELKWN